jgi:hypothetical protein
MGYVSKTIRESERIGKQLDALVRQVQKVFLPFGIDFSVNDWGTRCSRYAYLEASNGGWGVKLRVADHGNQSTQRNDAHVSLVAGNKYTDEQIWRAVLRAIAAQVR